jgi:hypothetical protein
MPRGQPPVGYTSIDGRRERDPVEADQVYALFRAVAEGRSAREAADMLGWQREQVRRVLHRREYAFGELPIVTADLWEQAHRQLAKGRPQHRKHKGPRR